MNLQRPQEGRVLAGVSRALAKRFDIPVWIIRVLFIILVPLPPSALLIYLVLWILIPEEPVYTVINE